MNIIPQRWSHEWFTLTTTDELMRSLREAKRISHKEKSALLWNNRINRLKEEIQRRQFEEQDWMYEKRPL
jgi:hypothetical protein